MHIHEARRDGIGTPIQLRPSAGKSASVGLHRDDAIPFDQYGLVSQYLSGIDIDQGSGTDEYGFGLDGVQRQQPQERREDSGIGHQGDCSGMR